MMKRELEQLKQKVQNLAPIELAKFHAWFIEFDHSVWDKEIEAESKVKKLDGLFADALADLKAG